MKRTLLVIALILGLMSTTAHAGLIGPGKLSIGADVSVPYWIGYGIGYSIPVTPLIEVGGEYSYGTIEKNDFDTSVPGVTGAGKITGSRMGITAKFNLPILPIKIHAGTHSGKLTSSLSVKIPGADTALPGGDITGSYFDIGLDYQLGPIFIEPRIGVQSISVGGTSLQMSKLPISDLGIRAGVVF